mgnify:FL=1
MEYAVLLGIAGIALSTMQIYFKRGIQSVVKAAADEVGNQKDGGGFDLTEGVKSQLDSKVRRVSSGAPAGEANLETGVAERTVVKLDSRTKYTYSVSEVKPYCGDSGECTQESYSKYVNTRRK